VSGNAVRVSDLPEKFHQALPPHGEEIQEGLRIPDHIPRETEIPERGVDLNALVNKMERSLIINALEKTGGVRSRAASLLGLNRTTLIEKMKKMGIEMKRG
jgi:DNA-binding NtrC family response regulator